MHRTLARLSQRSPLRQSKRQRHIALLLLNVTLAVCGCSLAVSRHRTADADSFRLLGSPTVTGRRAVVGGLPVILASSLAAGCSNAAVATFDTINVFGRIATPECYGKTASRATCQINSDKLKRRVFRDGESGISLSEFKSRLNELEFEWPLKPYGETSENKEKTATLNKPAELSVWKEISKAKNLVDPFYLNGKDRDRVNRAVQSDSVTDEALQAFVKILGKNGNSINKEDLTSLDGMDWFQFVDLMTSESP